MIRKDMSIICTIDFVSKNKYLANYTTQYCYIYCVFVRVCDVITPEVEIGGQFRKVYLNGTLICYNLDCNGFCVTSKLTNLWTKNS